MTTWSYLKAVIDQKAIYPQYTESEECYFIKLYDGQAFIDECVINKIRNAQDAFDFETNYKPYGNQALVPRDSDGSPLSRIKTTKAGWHYQPHSIEFTTAVIGSAYNKDMNGNDLGFVTLKLYDVSNNEITNPLLQGNAVKTVIDWMPDHDYEIIGAKYYQDPPPTDSDLRLWVIGVPDIPAPNGSIVFAQGGVNLKYVGTGAGLNTDGRSSKLLVYDPILKTNKFRVVLKHNAGFQHKAMIVWEIYKAL